MAFCKARRGTPVGIAAACNSRPPANCCCCAWRKVPIDSSNCDSATLLIASATASNSAENCERLIVLLLSSAGRRDTCKIDIRPHSSETPLQERETSAFCMLRPGEGYRLLKKLL